MLEILAGTVGGVGFVFVGMWLLTKNLKSLSGYRLRQRAARLAKNAPAAMLLGAASGAVAQNTTALAFIAAGTARSGILPLHRIFPLLLGANVGNSLLILVVTFDVKPFALFVLGIAGLLMISGLKSRFRRISGAVFGMAMLFFGLVLLEESAAPMLSLPWFNDVLEWSNRSLGLVFLAAMLLTCLIQSGVAVKVLGIGLATVDLLTVDQAIMVVYGSCLGSSLTLYMLSRVLDGISRQIAMYQVSFNVVLCAVFVPLLYVELHFGVPLVKAATFSHSFGLAEQLALIAILSQVLTAAVNLVVMKPCIRLFAKLWPPTQTEVLSKPRYLNDQALSTNVSTLLLVDLEQQRMLGLMSDYIGAVQQGQERQHYREAVKSLRLRIDEYLNELQVNQPEKLKENFHSMVIRQRLLGWLEYQLEELSTPLLLFPPKPCFARLRNRILKRTSAALQLLSHVHETGEDGRMVAERLIYDRNIQIRYWRDKYLEREFHLDLNERTTIFQIADTVQHILYILSGLIKELEHSPAVLAHTVLFHVSPGPQQHPSRLVAHG